MANKGYGKSRLVWRSLDALWYREEKGKPTAHGTTPFRASVIGNPRSEVRVGVVEEVAGATGMQWRASVWLASYLATSLLGHELTDAVFLISTGGFIDGPSAGALMAVGFMAAMTGAKIRPWATMTGALGPDGSLLPVGGVPEKVLAAKAAGKRLLGIPAGQGHYIEDGKPPIDVLALGKRHGVEVREIPDLAEAYHLLTGARLREIVPLPSAEMAVPEGTRRRLEWRIPRWVAAAEEAIRSASRDPDPVVQSRVARARRAIRKAADYRAAGHIAAAYTELLQASVWARAVGLLASLNQTSWPRIRQGIRAIKARIASLEARIEKAVARAGNPIALLSAAGAIVQARGFFEVAALLIGQAKENLKIKGLSIAALRKIRESGKAYLPAVFTSLARLYSDISEDLLHVPPPPGKPLHIDRRRLQSVARSLVSAAVGNLKMIDALLLEEVAEARGTRIETIRAGFAVKERSFLLAMRLAQRAVEDLKSGTRKRPVGRMLLQIAAAASSYVTSAAVLTNYYALGGGTPEAKGAEGARRRRALEALLARARHLACRIAAVAKRRIGAIPPSARIFYAVGHRFMRSALPGRKIWALSSFWHSGVLSRVAASVLRR